MNQVLTDLFGENTVAAELAVTAVVVLALIALAVLLTQRFARSSRAGRARVPRLAIVDALSIDNRRKLVLVRRDAVEHLILIGGPGDVVVEPSIQRPRPRILPTIARDPDLAPPEPVAAVPVPAVAQHPTGNGVTAMAVAPAVAPPAEARMAIPFPFTRVPTASSPPAGLGARRTTAPVPGEVMPSEFAPHLGWSAVGSSPAPALGPGPDSKPNGADRSQPRDDVAVRMPPPAQPNSMLNGNGTYPGVPSPSPPAATAPAALPGEDTALARVSELEVEMNRLLGQLSAERRSP